MNREMTVPKTLSAITWEFALTAFVGFFVALAVVDLFVGIAIIPAVLWLAFVVAAVGASCRRDGGLRRYLVNRMGEMVGRKFVEYSSNNVPAPEIRLGVQFRGHRLIQEHVPIDKIESVEWVPGQATWMAGRDMKDWHVCLWFDHCDPIKSSRRTCLRKPDQDLFVVGPSTHKEKTAAFGLELVGFLREVGVELVPSDDDNCFVRSG